MISTFSLFSSRTMFFHARAAHADTRAHRVHFFVCAPDCDLGAIARFSRDAANLHRTIRDFAYLQLEKPAYKIGMAARYNDLGAANSIFHRDDVRTDAIPPRCNLLPPLARAAA